MEEILTKEQFREIIGAAKGKKLKDAALDAGENFLVGKATSALTTITNTETFGNAAALANELGTSYLAAANLIRNLTPEHFEEFAMEIANSAINYATYRLTKKLEQVIGEVMKPPDGTVILKNAEKIFKDKIKGDFDLVIAEELGKSTEERTKEQVKELAQSKVKVFLNSCTEKAKVAQDFINKYSDDISAYITTATYYMAQGEDFVYDNIMGIVNPYMKTGEEFVDKSVIKPVNDLRKLLEQWAGETAGNYAYELYKAAMKEQINAAKQFIAQQEAMVRAKAEAVVKKQVNSMLAQVGIGGVTIPTLPSLVSNVPKYAKKVNDARQMVNIFTDIV